MAKAKKKAKAKVLNLPVASEIPAGMKAMGGGYAPTWTPEEIGDSIHGEISALVKELTLNKGTKKENTTRVIEVTTMEGDRFAVWESATLIVLFDDIAERDEDALGDEVYIRFDGLGKKKGKNNPPKLFTVAIAE